MVDEAVIAACDPGIRDTVRLLQERAFCTTDSGDGVSKSREWYEDGEALPFPHVACVTSEALFFTEARRLQGLLGANWRVEASYCPRDGACVLVAMREEA